MELIQAEDECIKRKYLGNTLCVIGWLNYGVDWDFKKLTTTHRHVPDPKSYSTSLITPDFKSEGRKYEPVKRGD